MLISKRWILSLLQGAGVAPADFAPTDEEFDQAFVRVGFETEGYAPIPQTTGPLVVGVVEHIEELTGFKKPIRHCQVNVGQANGTGELQSIVCGARNFQEGDTVVVALPGTVLPGDFAIATRKTYGKISDGMICSAAELGMTDKQNSGIMVLPAAIAEPGASAYELLGLDDTVFDVNITPDRGYALSLRGLAREIASAYDLPYVDVAADPSIAGITCAPIDWQPGEVAVSLDPATKARRFGLVTVAGIDPTVESPLWMQRELMLCGQRPVNAATDITNYVMMLLGQPMHAFDAAKIHGDLVVRNAQPGERLTTLDEKERELSAEDVVICDDAGVQSLAGVMGGATSEISATTTDVHFEAASWDPITVARTCRRHKLTSEASRRFERGVDPAIIEVALDIAASLLVQIAGGSITGKRTLVGEVPAMPVITMDALRPQRIAGKEIPASAAIGRLQEVGCAISETDGELTVTPPTWRGDITMPADLVEEVLRLEGLDDIPSITPTSPSGRGLSMAQRRRRAVGHALAYNGYVEIIPTPFIANNVFDLWDLAADDPRRNTVKVANPLESDYGQLATTLLPSLCEVVARNVARGNTDVALYGVAQVAHAASVERTPMLATDHRPTDDEVKELLHTLPQQPLHVAAMGTGLLAPVGPAQSTTQYSWSDAIEAARIVAGACGVQITVEQAEMLPWHPGRCAAITFGDDVLGYAGELHPKVIEALHLPERTCAMELDLSPVLTAPVSLPAPELSPYPALLQDVALVVDEALPAESVRQVLAENAGPLLEQVELFDVYTSERLGAGKKSLAFNLRFRAADRTLTDEECNEAKQQAVAAAEAAFGAQQRA
ncbi:phenylalanine--tRNA ligase subunit beta [Corynebacterium choanae]|uniref:Phenylalanine--tRNA ligase beta subunit n=1 Tax=Corynebacterium choanae TaxID=1862358 RepID=A0A3G6J6L9_9CORY|nr:phenylalanine--tRNA ligase subunit beta [Corynebacterium choanae]AZA13462.1 Phenylalanine--tRNA ligase beta subunit [Corynebacterium choanae]